MKRKSVLTGLLLVVLALSAACSKGPDDTAIANDIKAKIFSDPDLKGAAIDVAVKDGVVTLTGDLANAEQQLKLYKLAQAAAGVSKVDDQIRIQEEQAAEAQPPLGAPSPTQAAHAPQATRGDGMRPARDAPAVQPRPARGAALGRPRSRSPGCR